MAKTRQAGAKAAKAYSTLTLAVAGRVATITLARPQRLNAINDEMPGEIRAAVLACDARALPPDKLALLLDIVPTAEELAQIGAFEGDRRRLGHRLRVRHQLGVCVANCLAQRHALALRVGVA